MRNKHIHIANDSALLKTIYQEVEANLIIDPQKTTRHLCLKFIFYFSLTAFSYIALIKCEHPILFIACFIFFGFVSILFAFNFSHDFSHNTIFKSKQWNHICFVAIYTLVGAHAEAWKKRHVESHHYAPNVEDYDSDLQISNLIRVIPNSEYKWFHKYQHIYASFIYTSYSLFWVFVKDFVILFSKDEKPIKNIWMYHLSFWIQKICYISYILMIPMMFSFQPWYMVLIGFVCMHLTQSLFLLFTFFMTHHVEETSYPTTNDNGFINTSWLMNQVKSSNDMHPFSPTANFILGGFNNHIAHHLFPHIHHIHYPKLSRILYKVLNKKGIQPNETTYFGGIQSHLKLLKKMSVTAALICFALCNVSYAQIGIQTNILGYTALPILIPQYYSIELGIENKLYKKFILKTSLYYLNQNDTTVRNGKVEYQDHLRKYGSRIAMKFYPKKLNDLNEMPTGFYLGSYSDMMFGRRTITKNNQYIQSVENRTGMYASFGFNRGYTFSADHLTIEPNIGLGLSKVSKNLIVYDGWFDFDELIQSLSSCHLQLNVGYRF